MIQSVSSAPRVSNAPTYRPAVKTAAVEPTGGSFSVSNMGDTLHLGSSLGTIYNGAKTALDGGRALKPDALKVVKSLKGLKGNGILDGFKGVVTGALPFAKRSAIFEGAISLVTNGYQFATGKIGLPEFGSRVVGDTLGGAAGGVGGAIAGGVGLAALGAVGLTGTMLTIGGVVAGMVGYTIAENVFRRSGIFHSITGMVRNALGG